MRTSMLFAFPIILGAGLIASASAQTTTSKSPNVKVCGKKTYDHVLKLHYPSSGSDGCVGWNGNAEHCNYVDDWNGGREGSSSCKLKENGTLIMNGFPYAAKNSGSRFTMKLYFQHVDTARDCFKSLVYWWGNRRGDGDPRDSSVCQ